MGNSKILDKLFQELHPIFSLTADRESWMCTAAEFIQIAEELGYRCIKNISVEDVSFHFISENKYIKPNIGFIERAQKIGVVWWEKGWEERVINARR